jgi:hypothetical protein
MAPPLSSSFPKIEIQRSKPLGSSETAVVYLVRTLGLVPEPFNLTTGTFNLVVKDRTAFRLSGAYSVQADPENERERPHLQRIRLSSKPCKVTRCVLPLSTHCPHRIFTCFPQLDGNCGDSSAQRNTTSASAPVAYSGTQPFQARARRKSLISKKIVWRFLRKPLKPFKALTPRIPAPWPELIQVLPNRYSLLLLLDAGRATRVAQYVRLATHCSRFTV